MDNATLIGIDTAKNIFHLYAVNQHGKKVYQRALKRAKLLPFIAQHPATTIAIEACSGSHYWARKFKELGHKPLIIAAQRVKQFATRNKNDFNDARAITKAARDEDTYFVPQKTQEQQTDQAIHMLRENAMTQATATINQIRNFLVERGIIVSQGRSKLIKAIPDILEDAENELMPRDRVLLQELYESIKYVRERIVAFDKKIKASLAASPEAQRLKKIPGVGPLISTALSCMIADPSVFKKGRNCAASIGLTPKENSTGGKQRLGKISKQGNAYLRKILVQGAHSILRNAHKKDDPLSVWATQLKEAKGTNITVVALANKIARIAWYLLAHKEEYNYQGAKAFMQ